MGPDGLRSRGEASMILQQSHPLSDTHKALSIYDLFLSDILRSTYAAAGAGSMGSEQTEPTLVGSSQWDGSETDE